MKNNHENLDQPTVMDRYTDYALGAVTVGCIAGTVWGLAENDLVLAGVSFVTAIGSVVVRSYSGEPGAFKFDDEER